MWTADYCFKNFETQEAEEIDKRFTRFLRFLLSSVFQGFSSLFVVTIKDGAAVSAISK
jgi:hypothetical protein